MKIPKIEQRQMERWVRRMFFVLAGIAGILFATLGVTRFLTDDSWGTRTRLSSKTENTTENKARQSQLSFPLAPTHPNVSSVLIHYFVTGIVREVRQTSSEPELILDTTGSEPLPPIRITPETRISKITPPYSSATSQSQTIRDILPGLRVDASIEYDIRASTWMIRDVFIPTDRNL